MGPDPSEIRDANDVLSVSVSAGHTPIKNIYLATVSLTNEGQAPILPTDIFDNISLTTKSPWKIITVTSSDMGPQTAAFKWKKANDLAFRAEPALINPGDQIFSTVYMTYPDGSDVKDEDKASPPLEWGGRISNLSAITPYKFEGFHTSTSNSAY